MRVDVGVVCLRLGAVHERRGIARKLAAELIQRADKLMYDAKGIKSVHVHTTSVRVTDARSPTSTRPPPSPAKLPGSVAINLKASTLWWV